MNAKLITLMLLGSLPTVAGAGNNSDDLTAYPAAEDGVDRLVFRVPAVHDESILKIEIIVGKTLSADCNRTSFSGLLELRIADGWGYPYFVLGKIAGPMSTRMVCPPETQHVERFVLVTGDGNELSH